MRLLLAILSSIILHGFLQAQDVDSLNSHFQNISVSSDKLSLSNKIDRHRPSAIHKVDRLTNINTLDTLVAPKTLDTLEDANNRIHHKLDSARNLMTSKVDSLQNVAQHAETLADSLLSKKIARTIVSQDSLLNSKVSISENKINAKLNLFNSSGANLGALALPKPVKDLTSITVPMKEKIGANLSSIKISGVHIAEFNNLEKIKMPSVSQLKNVTISKDLFQLKTPAFGNVGKDVANISTIPGEVGKYGKDVKALVHAENPEQVQKELETKLEEIGDVKKLEAQTLDIEKYKEMEKKWSEDPDTQKEMALKKAKEGAVDYFAGHEQQLQSALSKATQTKEKFKGAEGVLDVVKMKQENAMKGKPFSERFIPGLAMQIQKPSMLWVDFNPYLSYRLSGRFTIAAGWNERIVYETKTSKFFPDKRLYGFRSSVQLKIKESLWLKTDVEYMNVIIPQASLAPVQDQHARSWVSSYFGGVKKDFRFSSRLVGSTQILYNLYDPKHQSPYANRLNIRISFEYRILRRAAENEKL